MLRCFALLALIATSALAAPNHYLIPVFAERVPGANGSTWQSELRIYNPGSTTSVLTVASRYPYGSVTCAASQSLEVASKGMVQVRSVGCQGGAAGVDIIADDSLLISSVITNVGGTAQDPCCLSGFTQMIPIVKADTAYAYGHTVANLQDPGVACQNLGRHNVGIVNPGSQSASITVRLFDAAGQEVAAPPNFRSITVPAGTLVQINDVLPQASGQITCVTINGWFRYELTSNEPVYVYDSYVDNLTNDATFIESKP